MLGNDLRPKLVLGVPFYGRHTETFEVAPKFSLCAHPKAKTYAELVTNGADPSDDVIDNYYFNGVETIEVDTKICFNAYIQWKTKFVIENGYAGIMVWELGQDSVIDEMSLLLAIRRAATESTMQEDL